MPKKRILFIALLLPLVANGEVMGGRSITTTVNGVKLSKTYDLEIPDFVAQSQPDFDPLNNISMPMEKAIHKAEVAFLKKTGKKYYRIKSVSLRPFHSNRKSWYYDIFIGQTRLAVLSSGQVVFEKERK
ncbi:hypothetical protein CWB99_22915 [Pseudoalteromonas rubra]|uniref:PepSY domain-containing protein n=1 Tax=Pseudoalteromonas rubra TaxID=43658 RepID=A0A5S3WF10_9GAMM|nr:hypothetical protein [Pseudoalteromonas rubra]TMP23951.1 hypothetical protein CWB99_22915 [Pseudoalteromonas rubra]TMP27848.1 hypothetical protein CWC00_22590 [Pseudoalteromonas rubra]